MRIDIPSGTLYMLILKTLARLGMMHGYGIAQHISETAVRRVMRQMLPPAA